MLSGRGGLQNTGPFEVLQKSGTGDEETRTKAAPVRSNI